MECFSYDNANSNNKNNNNNRTTAVVTEEENNMSDYTLRRQSCSSSPSTSSYNKMSIDSDDGGSISSMSNGAGGKSAPRLTIRDEVLMNDIDYKPPQQQKKIISPLQKSYDLRERRGGDPERRSVNRRSSLLVCNIFMLTWFIILYLFDCIYSQNPKHYYG
jgi:hypothetical protein